jgi:hypothetical protein
MRNEKAYRQGFMLPSRWNGLDIRVWLSLSMCRMRVYACYEVGVGIGRGAC